MRKYIFILFYLPMACLGQNLVPNPSFEQYSTCPNSAGQIDYSAPWFAPTTGTPDYFNSCINGDSLWGNILGVPYNAFGFQNARTGSAYSGLFTQYPSNYREYIEVQLTTPLVSGIKYYISFFISLADSAQLASDDIGMYLSPVTISTSNNFNLSYVPQIYNPEGNFLSDKLNWMEISGEYIAVGGEKYIVIGNFKDDANTDIIGVAGGGVLMFQDWDKPYYYIDDICVSTDSSLCLVTSNIQTDLNNTGINIFPNPTKDELFISVNDKKIKSAFIEIIDLAGKLVYSSEIAIDEMVGKLNLNIQNGIYLIKITESNSKNQTVRKVVINK